LLDSQIRELETPDEAIVSAIDKSPEDICMCIIDEIIRKELLSQSYIRSINLG
jgi:hypothetical protein